MNYLGFDKSEHFDRISLYHGDCMDLMKQTPDKYYDLCIIDPPYGLKRFSEKTNRTEGSKYRKSMQKMCDNSHRFNDNKPTSEYWLELNRISKSQIIWGANNFELPSTEYFLIWNKEQTVENFASAELAFVYGLKKPAKVFTYQIHKHNQNKISDHSSEKPVCLYDWIIRNYAQPNQKILDTHLGSCSIVLAIDKANKLDNMNLEFVGIELDDEYFSAGVNRFRIAHSQACIPF